ncbi:ATP-binding protein [Bradyrhizobium brasilense]|uniref:ATP-binding protein n=1 Tax=Bradyrhizobium brasilense TaxID=1419277 RepID=UPI003221FE1F
MASSVLYQHIQRIFDDLELARSHGRHQRLLHALGCIDLLILDDWECEPLAAGASHDLLELLDDRYSRRSTIVTGELPMGPMASLIGGPTYADAALDRFILNA